MQIINTRKKHTPALYSQNRSWLPSVLGQFGDFKSFVSKFKANFEVQAHCALNIPRAVEMGDAMPTLTRALIAYGARQILSLLNSHFAVAIAGLGDHCRLSDTDVKLVAMAIRDNAKAHPLKFSTVLGFFHHLRMGEYKIYGDVNPRKFMEAFNDFCDKALDEEYRARLDLEQQREKEAFERHRRECVPWTERARRLGLPEGTDFLSYHLSTLQNNSDNQ